MAQQNSARITVRPRPRIVVRHGAEESSPRIVVRPRSGKILNGPNHQNLIRSQHYHHIVRMTFEGRGLQEVEIIGSRRNRSGTEWDIEGYILEEGGQGRDHHFTGSYRFDDESGTYELS